MENAYTEMVGYYLPDGMNHHAKREVIFIDRLIGMKKMEIPRPLNFIREIAILETKENTVGLKPIQSSG